MATPETVSRMFVLLRANWPTYELTAETPRVYEELLADIPDRLLELAVKDCLARLTYFPKIAELREAALSILEDRLGIPTAAAAWGEVSKAMKYGKPTRCPDFSHPAIRAGVDAVGDRHELQVAVAFRLEGLFDLRARPPFGFFQAEDGIRDKAT